MDLILDILIPKKDLERLNIAEKFIEWGGEKCSQEPKKYEYGSKLMFHENTEMSYYKNIVQDSFEVNDYLALTLEGESLSKLEFMVNRNKSDEYESEILTFFNELYDSLDTFCIIKLLNEERIDAKYSINNVNKAIEVFISSLDWNSPKGILIRKIS